MKIITTSFSDLITEVLSNESAYNVNDFFNICNNSVKSHDSTFTKAINIKISDEIELYADDVAENIKELIFDKYTIADEYDTLPEDIWKENVSIAIDNIKQYIQKNTRDIISFEFINGECKLAIDQRAFKFYFENIDNLIKEYLVETEVI